MKTFGSLAQAAIQISQNKSTEAEETNFGVQMIPELARAIGSMSDEDSDYILDACLKTVQRQEAAGWQMIMTPNGQIFYPDIDLSAMVQIAAQVIQDNLGNFFRAPLQPQAPGAAAPL